MKWVGLTGGIGTGKTTVATYLRRLGFSVVDADLIAKKVIQKGTDGYDEVIKQFGRDILTQESDIDRKKMADLVFKNANQLNKLESIIHPRVRNEVNSIKVYLEEQGHELAFYDVPLLYEKNMQNDFDGVLLVTTNEDLRIKRIQERNGWDLDHIQSVIQSQRPLAEKQRMANWVIENNGSFEDLHHQIELLVIKILSKN